MAVKAYGRYFTETAYWCGTDEISRCYFQNYPQNVLLLFESPPPEELRWEPKERVMTLLCGEKKNNFLESFVLGGKNRMKNR